MFHRRFFLILARHNPKIPCLYGRMLLRESPAQCESHLSTARFSIRTMRTATPLRRHSAHSSDNKYRRDHLAHHQRRPPDPCHNRRHAPAVVRRFVSGGVCHSNYRGRRRLERVLHAAIVRQWTAGARREDRPDLRGRDQSRRIPGWGPHIPDRHSVRTGVAPNTAGLRSSGCSSPTARSKPTTCASTRMAQRSARIGCASSMLACRLCTRRTCGCVRVWTVFGASFAGRRIRDTASK